MRRRKRGWHFFLALLKQAPVPSMGEPITETDNMRELIKTTVTGGPSLLAKTQVLGINRTRGANNKFGKCCHELGISSGFLCLLMAVACLAGSINRVNAQITI